MPSPPHFPILACLMLAGATPAVAANEFKLCVLDQNTLLLQSELAVNMAAQFQQVRRQAQESFENDMRTLEADARALDGLGANLPAAVTEARAADIERRRVQLQERGNQINRDLAELDAELTKNVMMLADPMIRAAQLEHGCSMLAARSDFLYVNDASLDITADVLKRMNFADSPLRGR